MSILTHDTSRQATGDLFGGIGHALARAGNAVWNAMVANGEAAAHRYLVASLSDRQLADLGIAREPSRKRSFDPHTV
ncbi:MAG: hypothetical protein VW644_03395 [Alphaproteobacteria bacterium]|jgi:hypothetical protein